MLKDYDVMQHNDAQTAQSTVE